MLKTNGIEKTVVMLFLAAGSLLMLFPFFFMLMTSLKTVREAEAIPPVLMPAAPQWHNFATAWTSAPFNQFLYNSLFVSLIATLLTLLFGSMAGYAFSKLHFKCKQILFLFVLSTLMIPGQITMIPVYLFLRDAGLLNSQWGLVAIALSSGFGVFLMKQFIQQLPNELLDAARIDGCSEYRIFAVVIVPLILPAFAALAIFVFIGNWESFFWPLIILDTENKFTLPLGLSRFQGEYHTDVRMIMVISLIMTMPVFALFLAFQQSFVKGVAFSAIKG